MITLGTFPSLFGVRSGEGRAMWSPQVFQLLGMRAPYSLGEERRMNHNLFCFCLKLPWGLLCQNSYYNKGSSWNLISMLLTVQLGEHGIELILGQVVLNTFSMNYSHNLNRASSCYLNLLTQHYHIYNNFAITYIFILVFSSI